MTALEPRLVAVDGSETRRQIAETLGVLIEPSDANPWGLSTSLLPSDWGVSPSQAHAAFERVQRLVAMQGRFKLQTVRANEVPFGMYEDLVIDSQRDGGIVAAAFDYALLCETRGKEPPRRRAHHVVRLTPIGVETELRPNTSVPEFGFDYDGDVQLFDDSGEVSSEELLVPWSGLLAAMHEINGAFWVVHHS